MTILFILLSLILSLAGDARAQTFTRGQWTQHGTGNYFGAYWRSDGTAKDLAGNSIPAGQSLGEWLGGPGQGGSANFTVWSQGGVWDTTRNRFIACCGSGHGGWVNFDVNEFDIVSGTWNPDGRPQRSYSEMGKAGEYPAEWILWGVHPNDPLAYVDRNNHYPDIADINPTTGTRLLPNWGHHHQALVWMPTVQRMFYGGTYGTHWGGNGTNPGVWEWDPATRKWSLDIQGNDLWPAGHSPENYGPILCAAWDSKRNRVIALAPAVDSNGTLLVYDPTRPQGSRITRILTGTIQMRQTQQPQCIYDSKRDHFRVYGGWPELGGQSGLLDFSGGHDNNPTLRGFSFTGTWPFRGSSGILYDPVADKDVMWQGGKTMWVANLDTHEAQAITPAGDDPGLPLGLPLLSIWSRFAYIPGSDAYATITSTYSPGAYIFAPDRTSGPLASTPTAVTTVSGTTTPSTPTAAPLASTQQHPPRLFFTDLPQGPRSGNGDTSRGQTANQDGAIVTIWGQNLGASQGGSTITVGGVAPTVVYYWGNATPPACGPANLYNGYQKYQCIIFQIDHTTPTGAQNTAVTINGVVATYTGFIVTSAGEIYYAGTAGRGAGTYAAPFTSVQTLLDRLGPNDVGYVMDGVTVPGGVAWPASTVNPTAHMSIAAYPGATVTFGDTTAHNGVNEGPSGAGGQLTWSKFDIRGGASTPNWAMAIQIREQSDIIGSRIRCPNGMGSTGCVGIYGSSVRFMGNEVTQAGTTDPGTFDGLYHTIYVYGRRSVGAPFLERGRILAYNYLHDNGANRGFNIYNAELAGNNPISDHDIHDNVILNQEGDGIMLGGGVVGNNWVYNNLIINAGRRTVNPATNAGGTCLNLKFGDPPNVAVTHDPNFVKVYNNTMLNCGASGGSRSGTGVLNFEYLSGTVNFKNNLIYQQAAAFPYVTSGRSAPSSRDATKYSNNLWMGAGTPPIWDSNAANANPRLVSATGTYDLHLQATSPAIGAGLDLGISSSDFDGLPRPSRSAWDIGAYQLGR